MKILKKPHYLLFNPHFLVITILALGSIAVISALGQRTQTQQHASQEINLNTAQEIDTTINVDGTMGPKFNKDNFSNTLPSEYLGILTISIADSQKSPSQITSLKLTLSKIEVHLIHLFIPGQGAGNTLDSNENEGNMKTNQNVNKWETLFSTTGANQISLEFASGNSNSLEPAQLAGGKYSEIRFYIMSASLKLADGKEVEIVIPGRNNIIRVVRPFNIYAGRTTRITLALDKENSIIQAGDKYILQPVVSGISINN